MTTTNAPSASQKELMFRAEMLSSQLEQIEERLSHLDRQAAEISSLKNAVEEFKTLKKGDEMLVPLAPGMFAKASFAGEHDLLVNVGQGVVVPKDTDAVQTMLDEQSERLHTYQNEIRAQFEHILTELQSIQQTFSRE